MLSSVCDTLVSLAVALDGIERLRKRALGSDTGGRTTCFSKVNIVIFQSSFRIRFKTVFSQMSA